MNLPFNLQHTTPRKLFIGPWVGEFGVEILQWQGLARAVAQSEPWLEIIVACQPDRRWLYADFANRFCDFVPKHREPIARSSGGTEMPAPFENEICPSEGDVWLNPRMSIDEWQLWRGFTLSSSVFRNFAQNAPHPESHFDILIHARATNKAKQSFKNWPYINFEQLIAALPQNLRIASVGSEESAHHITGTQDMRGLPLEELAGLCGSARLFVGPSSGPIHFAMHCGTPTLAWVRQNQPEFYFPQFNPFHVPLCLLPTWQPSVELVVDRAHQMLALSDSRLAPVKWCVFGTKRSGHHGFIEWLIALYPEIRITHFNDCMTDEVMTPPSVSYWLPTRQSHPKEINRPSAVNTVFTWNNSGRHHAKLLSFEGVPIHLVKRIPEVHHAEKLIFVLRDAANLIASCKKGLSHLQKLPLVDSGFREVLNVYRDYLREGLGQSTALEDLASRAVFVSYNRWHTDPAYRAEIAVELGSSIVDPNRGKVSSYSHTSGFEKKSTDADKLQTLGRWRQFQRDDQFWSVAMDPEIANLESQFHQERTPLNMPWSQSHKSTE
jgi:hypothetical protein